MNEFSHKAFLNKLTDLNYDIVDVRLCVDPLYGDDITYIKFKHNSQYLYAGYCPPTPNMKTTEFETIISSLAHTIELYEQADKFKDSFFEFVEKHITAKSDYIYKECVALDINNLDFYLGEVRDLYYDVDNFLKSTENVQAEDVSHLLLDSYEVGRNG